VTATVSSTTTTTIATTTTVFAPLATYYAACGTDNQVSTIDGRVLSQFDPTPNTYTITPSTGAYDCCAMCIQDESCGASFFLERYSYGNAQTCYMMNNGGICSGSRPVGQIFNDVDNTAALTASNGNCGQWSYA
jgi:hypothetical protein